jgi:tetratricopeptide (TPR) repeat protein
MRSLFFSIGLVCFVIFSSFGQQVDMKQGIMLIDNENYTEAQKFFEGVISKDPKNGAAHYYVGQIKYLLEDYVGASDSYNKGLTANSKCTECQIGAAKILLDNGKNLEADKVMENIAKSNKKKGDILSMIGEAYLYNKKPVAEKAIDFLTRSRDVDPAVSNVWDKLGDAFKLKGDSGSAMSAFETAAEKDPKNLQAVMKQAQIWANSGQLDLAIKKLEAAIGLSPNYAPAYKLMYELYLKARKYDIMLKPLTKYKELAGSDTKAAERLVKFLVYTAKDYDGAIREGKALLSTNPEEYTMHRWLAWAYGEKEMWEECYNSSKMLFAEVAKNSSRKTYESDYEYYAKAALNTAKTNPEREAEGFKAYEKVFEFSPNKQEDLLATLAKKAYTEKNWAKAIELYNKKNAVKELTSSELYNLAFCYLTTKDFVNSEKSYLKYAATNPTAAVAYYYAAVSANNLETGDVVTGKAKDHYLKYVELEKDLTTPRNKTQLGKAFDYLGGLAYTQGDKASAISYYERWIAIDPTNATATNQLTALKSGN